MVCERNGNPPNFIIYLHKSNQPHNWAKLCFHLNSDTPTALRVLQALHRTKTYEIFGGYDVHAI